MCLFELLCAQGIKLGMQINCNATDAVPLKLGFFGGSPSRLIHLDNVECGGTESSLLECQSNPIDVHNCDHSEDAGVRCQGTHSMTSIRTWKPHMLFYQG